MKLYSYKIKREFIREIETTEVCNPKAAAEAARAVIDFEREQEQLVIIFLNGRNQIKGTHLCTIGTLDASLVHAREVYRACLMAGGISGIIMAHNHPSNIETPSAADRQITKRIKEAGDILGIKLLDSIIVTEESYYSMANEKGGL